MSLNKLMDPDTGKYIGLKIGCAELKCSNLEVDNIVITTPAPSGHFLCSDGQGGTFWAPNGSAYSLAPGGPSIQSPGGGSISLAPDRGSISLAPDRRLEQLTDNIKSIEDRLFLLNVAMTTVTSDVTAVISKSDRGSISLAPGGGSISLDPDRRLERLTDNIKSIDDRLFKLNVGLTTVTSDVSAIISKSETTLADDTELTALKSKLKNVEIDLNSSITDVSSSVASLREEMKAYNLILDTRIEAAKYDIQIACSDETTPIKPVKKAAKFRMVRDMAVTEIRVSLSTPQVSGDPIIVRVNNNGEEVESIEIPNGVEFFTAYLEASFADNSVVTVDIEQVGDKTATGLKVAFIGHL